MSGKRQNSSKQPIAMLLAILTLLAFGCKAKERWPVLQDVLSREPCRESVILVSTGYTCPRGDQTIEVRPRTVLSGDDYAICHCPRHEIKDAGR
jgi:hypothetical protein